MEDQEEAPIWGAITTPIEVPSGLPDGAYVAVYQAGGILRWELYLPDLAGGIEEQAE